MCMHAHILIILVKLRIILFYFFPAEYHFLSARMKLCNAFSAAYKEEEKRGGRVGNSAFFFWGEFKYYASFSYANSFFTKKFL